MTKKHEVFDYLNNYMSAQKWLGHYRTRGSKYHMGRALYIFCHDMNMNPDEILKMRREQEQHLYDLIEEFGIKKTLPLFVIAQGIRATRSFLRIHRLDAPSVVGEIAMNPPKIKPVRVPTRKSLQQFLENAKRPQDKTLIIFLAATGIARGSIEHMMLKNIEPEWHKSNPTATASEFIEQLKEITTPHIQIIGQILGNGDTTLKGGGCGKYKGTEQHTFMTKECKDMLIKYLENRITPRDTLKTYSPLFSSRTEYTGMNSETVASIFKRISKKGLVFSPHDLRRFFQTALENVRISKNWIQVLKGRKVRGEDSPYSRPSIEYMRTSYKMAEQYLTIYTEEKV